MTVTIDKNITSLWPEEVATRRRSATSDGDSSSNSALPFPSSASRFSSAHLVCCFSSTKDEKSEATGNRSPDDDLGKKLLKQLLDGDSRPDREQLRASLFSLSESAMLERWGRRE